MIQNSALRHRAPMSCLAVVFLALSSATHAQRQLAATSDQVVSDLEMPLVLDGEQETLLLDESSVRGPDFQVLVRVPGGETLVYPSPPESTYKGSVRGWEDSRVFASVRDGEMTGWVSTDERTWRIGPGPRRGQSMAIEDHGRAQDSLCPVGGPGGSLTPGLRWTNPRGGTVALSTTKVCELAVEVNYWSYFYDGLESVQHTIDVVESILGATSDLFESDFDVVMEIGTIIVRTDPNDDPYNVETINYTGSGLLDKMEQIWANEFTGVHRDVGLFLQPFSMGAAAGTANVGSLCCENALAWGVVDLTVLTHELGHVFGASHCDGDPDCGVMCSSLGCNTGFFFGSQATGQIGSTVSTATCLQPAVATQPAVVTSIDPPEVQVFRGGNFELRGSGFDDVSRVFVDDGVTEFVLEPCSDYTGVSNFLLDVDELAGTNLGPVSVQVLNGAGLSAPTTFDFVPTSPPLLICEPQVAPGNFLHWSYGSLPDTNTFLLTAVSDDTTVSMGGFDVLANAASNALPALDALGMGSYKRKMPGALDGEHLYSQILTYDQLGNFVGASNIRMTAIHDLPPCGLNGCN